MSLIPLATQKFVLITFPADSPDRDDLKKPTVSTSFSFLGCSDGYMLHEMHQYMNLSACVILHCDNCSTPLADIFLGHHLSCKIKITEPWDITKDDSSEKKYPSCLRFCNYLHNYLCITLLF